MKQLLEAGVHFGHQTRRWNPKMREYIFTERNGIYIIDLQKTVKKIDEAYAFVRDIAMNNGTVLFVGTKKQAQDSIEQEAKRCEMFYVNQRWLGGLLTNFKTIQTRIAKLNEINRMEADGRIGVPDIGENRRILIVIGNEGNGVSDEVASLCELVRLPMYGRAESLNASVAASILIFCAAEAMHAKE